MENDKISYEELQRRYKQLAEAMGADIKVVTHRDCLDVALILNKIKEGMLHERYEDTGRYFICGEQGDKDEMQLPEKILVCPTHGLDGFAIYTKSQNYSAPGY